MKAKIRRTYRTSNVHEIGITYGDNYYLTIFGRHVNGWFIAIPNWGKSCEAAEPTDTFYNYEKLCDCFGEEAARAIAEAICTYWNNLQEAKENNEES